MRFGKRKLHHFSVYSALGIITAVLLILISYLGVSYQVKQQLSGLSVITMQEPVFAYDEKGSTANLINKLKYYGLWELPASEEVPRFFIKAYPTDINTVDDIFVKKRVFLHSLLPHALLVRQETLYRRSKLESILSRRGDG